MASKRLFVAIAKALRDTDATPDTAAAIASALAVENAAFDRARFLAAATVPHGGAAEKGAGA